MSWILATIFALLQMIVVIGIVVIPFLILRQIEEWTGVEFVDHLCVFIGILCILFLGFLIVRETRVDLLNSPLYQRIVK